MLYYIFHNVLMEIFKSIHYCTSLQQLLNHCFDDVEKFVARLQQAAEAYKELEKRKRDRNSKNKKKQNGGNWLVKHLTVVRLVDFVCKKKKSV